LNLLQAAGIAAIRHMPANRCVGLKDILTMYLLGRKFAATFGRSGRRRSNRRIVGTSVVTRAAPKALRPEEPIMSQVAEQPTVREIDVRSLVPAQRHEKIFQIVDNLAPGASFILINDHDPKPLYYQIEAEYPKQFSWTYLEKGPTVWRVEIGRVQQAT
jgi:uncharacterized protein (DUF2249 family)